MDRTTEQAAMVALLRAHRTGWKTLVDAVESCGSAHEVLVRGQPGVQQELFGDDPHESVAMARADIEAWEAEGLHLVTLLDGDYPGQLLTIHQRPPLLFYRGTLDSRDSGGIAVVGTRAASAHGIEQARTLATELARRDVPVISGLAAGIDTAAHRAALHNGGRTAAVIGTGLRRSYPAENAELQEALGSTQLVLSQFWPDAAPSKTSFPMRNAVMSGYAAATVVVEAPWQSGARMQARLALQHGRPVFLLESLLEHDWAREYANLPGTAVVSGPEDVLERLDEVLAPAQELTWA